EGEGQRQMVNLGRGQVAPPPRVLRLDDGDSAEVAFNVPVEAEAFQLAFHHLLDPAGDDEPERVRVRIWRNDPMQGRQLLWEDTLEADFSADESPYGGTYRFDFDEPIALTPAATGEAQTQPYSLEITALDGGPISVIGGLVEGSPTPGMATLGVQSTLDETVSGLDLSFEPTPILTGHGNDIPPEPTHWTPGGSDTLQFTIPIDGVIRTIEIPHLGDPLNDSDVETVHFTLIGPDGERRTATVEQDL